MLGILRKLAKPVRVRKARQALQGARDAYRDAYKRRDTRGMHEAIEALQARMNDLLRAEVGR